MWVQPLKEQIVLTMFIMCNTVNNLGICIITHHLQYNKHTK